jgi:hypothetical protein
MSPGKSKQARAPAWKDREKWRATKAEAIERGWQFYWPGRPCKGRRGPHDAWHSVSQGCLKCKELANRRYRYGEDEAEQARAQSAAETVGKRRHDLGLDRAAMPGRGSGYPVLIPQQAIARTGDAASNESIRLKLAGKDRDHIVPVPSRRDHGNLIIGLECAENLQGLSGGQNREKGDGCPLPSDFTRRAGRPLTVAEARWFVQRRMAVWAHDVVFGEDGKPARINWRLYRLGADGLVEYSGREPAP